MKSFLVTKQLLNPWARDGMIPISTLCWRNRSKLVEIDLEFVKKKKSEKTLLF